MEFYFHIIDKFGFVGATIFSFLRGLKILLARMVRSFCSYISSF
jgi:hypothetical protein